ncbi:MAG: DUF438 domain-containing protein [Candidatus Bathyarchaeota archaeon]
MKDIILRLHQGLSVEEAKDKFEREVGSISSTEIAEVEQSLINEGLSIDEIKKFCNVHALLFQSTLEKSVSKEESSAHPVYLFKLENREIEKLTKALKDMLKGIGQYELAQLKTEIKNFLTKIRAIDIHYTRKEQNLFPFLEKHGFFGPSKVMWGKDNEIRDLLKKSIIDLDNVNSKSELDDYLRKNLNPLTEEVEGMIFKEENILFPTSLEKLDINEWAKILEDSNEVGYVFIEKPKETESLLKELKKAVIEEPTVKESIISFPTGELQLKELIGILNTLPVEITYVDKDDTVRYFSDNKDRAFVRIKSIIGRKVQNCHPPNSVDAVEKILKAFKEGEREFADFWINFKEKLVYIKFLAVRDRDGKYIGTIEVTQDITGIRKLEGEKRLLDERN